MSAVDATKRKLQIKPTFVPYIEKHRIHELLYDIAVALSIRKPKDHILFVRNFLNDVNDLRDKPRIILVAPPHISIETIAEHIKTYTGAEIITLKDIGCQNSEDVSSLELAIKLSRYIEKFGIIKKGWLAYEFPRNFKEARMFHKHGILPSHAFEICSSPNNYSKKDAWFKNIKEWPVEKFREAITEFKRKALGLKRAFGNIYKEVPVKSRNEEEIAKAIVGYTRTPIFRGTPLLPRVVLIGTRGSGRRTIAKRLSEEYQMVHVDIDELILRGKKMDNEIGEQLRTLEKRNVPVYSKILISVLQQRLLQRDCLRKGWVLTGFPRDVADFKVLDSMETTPNKVIFLSIESSKAYQRIKNRKVNIFDGDFKTIDDIIESGEDIKEYFTHPRDYDVNIYPEQLDFAEHIEEMLKYCGDNCNIINAEGSDNEVYQRVVKIIMIPGNIAPPRKPDFDIESAKESAEELILKDSSHTTIYPNIVYEDEKSESEVDRHRLKSILTYRASTQ